MRLILAAILACAVTPAQAQTKEIAKAGQWSAWDGRSETNQPICTIWTKGKDWSFLFKWLDGVNYLQLVKQGWRIPLGTGVPMALQFDANEPHNGTASSRVATNNVWATFTNDVFQTVMKEFISSKTVHVKFPNGSDRGWSIGLDGSDKVARAYMKCVTDFEKKYQYPQPHQGGKEEKEGRT